MSEADVFHLSLVFRTGARAQPGRRLDVQLHRLHDADRHDDQDGSLVIWGTPALDGRILRARELAAHIRSAGLEALARRLDCGFLLVWYDRRADRLALVTDRTGSLPLFHLAETGRFVASSSFKRLFDSRGAGASPGLEPLAVAEFFYFRRVFGTRSYDRAISYLPHASILTVEADGRSERRTYWRIGADKLALSDDALAERLAALLRDSMATHMSDGRAYGLLLSGGLDARALLAAAPSPPICFTTTPKPNNELAVAAELARLKGAAHVYVPRPEQLLNEALDPAVELGGGMTVFNEVQFIGYGPQVTPRADTLFMGLALDIMFCGHYLPKSLVSYGGRNGWHFRLHALPADLPRAFVDTVSYRLKTSDPMRLIAPARREQVRGHLFEAVRQEMDEGRTLGLEGYDLWEYVHLHNLSRHYSLLMAQSVRTFAACRIPALANALYDLCWAMRAEDKANWSVYQKAIARLDPALMRVRNANTNIRADRPLWQQTAVKFARALAGRAGLRLGASPAWWDRSWPQARQSIDANPAIRARLAQLASSPRLAAVGLFDAAAIEAVAAEHLAGQHDHAVLLNELITIDRALEPFAG
jgi:hypothetical protein